MNIGKRDFALQFFDRVSDLSACDGTVLEYRGFDG